MAPALIAILSLIVLGIPAVLAIDRRARGPLLIGASFLYGSGLIFLILLALSIVHIRWTLLSVTIAALIAWCALWFVKSPSTVNRQPSTVHWLDLLTIFTFIGYTLYATLAHLWEWDFWAIWGLKARVFLEHGGIDWRFLESPWNAFSHPDYPLLVPFNYDFVAILNGGWSDRWLGLVMVACAAAVVLIVRSLVAEETTPFVAAIITTVATTLAISRYVGLAEGPLIAFGAAAVLFLRRAILFDDHAAWRHGAVLLGFAANVKNEGIALAVSIVIAIVLVRRKSLWRLWPAVAIAAPWLILRATHVLPTDVVGGSVLSRVIAHLAQTPVIFSLLWHDLVDPWFWVCVIAGIIVAPAVRRRREAFVFLVTGIQLVFYVAAYYATPHDPRWHIVTSWPRLTVQISLPITFVVLVMLADFFPRVEQSAPDAEAGPVE